MQRKKAAIIVLLALTLWVLCPAATPAPTAPNELGTEGISPALLQQIMEQIKQRYQQPFAEESSSGSEGTCFHVRYKNETAKGVDAGPLLEQSTILLDGKQYSYQGPEPKWFHIQAGEDRWFLMSPDDYVPKVKRSVLADTLHRWRWVSGIEPGEHTLILQFGGRHYGPVHYYWGGTGAWNVPHP